MIHHFELPGVTLSQNQLDGHNFWIKQKQKEIWHDLVNKLIPSYEGIPTRAKVSIIRVSSRLIDPLNCPAGMKWLLDAIVLKGWLTGDGYYDVLIFVDQRKCKKGEECMEVTIEYLEESK